MAQGNIQITGNASGGPDGGRTFGPISIVTGDAVASEQTIALVIGANTITVPAGATAMILWPPNATAAGGVTPNPPYGGALTLKGDPGDAGVPLSGQWPTLLAWDTAPAAIVVTSTAVGDLICWAM